MRVVSSCSTDVAKMAWGHPVKSRVMTIVGRKCVLSHLSYSFVARIQLPIRVSPSRVPLFLCCHPPPPRAAETTSVHFHHAIINNSMCSSSTARYTVVLRIGCWIRPRMMLLPSCVRSQMRRRRTCQRSWHDCVVPGHSCTMIRAVIACGTVEMPLGGDRC